MHSINEIAQVRRCVDAPKFLGLLQIVARRIESGHDESISIRECLEWGFTADEAVPYLLLLVQAGVLEQKVQVYDQQDDAFEDYRGQGGLEELSANQVRLWFKPALAGKDVPSFFLGAPAEAGGMTIPTAVDSVTGDNNFFEPVKNAAATFNGCTFFMGNDMSKNVRTGDVTGSVVGNTVKEAHVETSHNMQSDPGPKNRISKLLPLMFLGVGILILALLIFGATRGLVFGETATSLIRMLIAICVLPFLGTMAGDAFFKVTKKQGVVPVKIVITGHLAVFFITITLLTLLRIPAVTKQPYLEGSNNSVKVEGSHPLTSSSTPAE